VQSPAPANATKSGSGSKGAPLLVALLLIGGVGYLAYKPRQTVDQPQSASPNAAATNSSAAATGGGLAQTLTGLKVVKSPDGACQMAIPSSWNSQQTGFWGTQDFGAVANAHQEESLDQAKSDARNGIARGNKLAIAKEAPNLLLLSTTASTNSGYWEAVVPGNRGICSLVVWFPRGSEAVAQKVVDSLGPAR
jgi:hypothetical protein